MFRVVASDADQVAELGQRRTETYRLERHCGRVRRGVDVVFIALHGRYGEDCPVCGSPVQRIRYASNETNYCAPCQTGGKVLADRVLSQLMRGDWPSTLEVTTKVSSS